MSTSSSVNPASSRKRRARPIGLSSLSPRAPPKLNSLSTTCWNSSAFARRSGSFSVTRRSQSEPIFTWVTSSASIQSSQNSRNGSSAIWPNSFIWVNTSIASPSSARFTPASRSTGSFEQAASNSTVFSWNWPISVPIQSDSLALISTWRASSHAWRAMSSLSSNGIVPLEPSPASKSWAVRPAPSSAWISPTMMPCMSDRAASDASWRSGVRRLDAPRLFAVFLTSTAVRVSAIRSAMLVCTKRSSRARSSTGKN